MPRLRTVWTRPALVLLMLALGACASSPQVFDEGDESPASINAQLGLRYMQQGDYDVALEKLKRALKQDPRLPSAHHYIAELYRQLGNVDLAEQHYRRALRLAPEDGPLHNNYGVFLCDRRRYDEAEDHFLRAARSPGYRQPEEAFQNAALCALREPDPGQAERYFRRALEINPLLPNALYQMARLSFEAGRNLQARAFIQRYAAVARHTPQTLWLGVRIERALGDEQAAGRYATRLREEFPEAEETGRLGEVE